MAESGANGWSDGQATIIDEIPITSGWGAKWLVAARNEDGRVIFAEVNAAWDAVGNIDYSVTGTDGAGLAFVAAIVDGAVKVTVTPDGDGWSWRMNVYVV